MDEDLRLLSRLIRALNEPAHPGLHRLGRLLEALERNEREGDWRDSAELRGWSERLSAAPADDPIRRDEALRCRVGAQMVALALDWREGWLPPSVAQRRLADLCRILRVYGLDLPEAFAALLGARWLRLYDPAWALEMARRAAHRFEALRRAAAFQGRPDAELRDGIRQARRIIEEILRGPAGAAPRAPEGRPSGARRDRAGGPPSESPPPAPAPAAEAIPAPGWPLRPAKLCLVSFTLFPDAHPRAGDLQFLDPQSAERQSDEAEVLIETLEVGGQIYRPYVELDMEPIVILRPDRIVVLRVEGDSMRGAGITAGDLILAERIPGPQARDPGFWVSLEGQLVLAVLLEHYQTEAHRAFLVKRLVRRGGRWWLQSESPGFEELLLEPGLHEMHPVRAILKPLLR